MPLPLLPVIDKRQPPPLSAAAYLMNLHLCPDGGIGRRTSFRCWRSQGRGGSSPLLGTIFCLTSNAGRSHPRPWLSSHRLGRPVGLANPSRFDGAPFRGTIHFWRCYLSVAKSPEICLSQIRQMGDAMRFKSIANPISTRR